MQHDGYATLGNLPCGLAAGETATNDMYRSELC